MSGSSESSGRLSPLKRAYLALEEAEAKLRALERARGEPLAVIGIGCRTPGGGIDPDSLWRLLRDGVDAITEIPPNRWDVDAFYDADPKAPGKMSTRWGGFLEEIEGFDPSFFGISPREATGMDPQQRLLLEVAWEALENGGQAADRLTESRTGVFLGISRSDFAELSLLSGERGAIDAYYASGVAHSIASGRLSYVLGLKGPSLSIDTACSSSLLAVQRACQSLRVGECDLALAGGVNLILSPLGFIAFTKNDMLASDGRCKTFDAAADGFVSGEGCGVVVLKRLSDALREGDPIHAVIRGCAANQDGPSSGITVPNGPSQEAVIREALADGSVRPAEVAYVEAHGTGTPLGDPIELQALGAALGDRRPPDRPLLVGSIKTNMGHLEAAAGIVGLIKAALCVERGEIPPHLHFREPNPHVSWSQLPLQVVTERRAWPDGYERRFAGISSFGFSGTNVHVVLEQPPRIDREPSAPERPLHAIALSARTEPALRELTERHAAILSTRSAPSLPDVAHTLAAGRAHWNHRLFAAAADVEGACTALRDVLEDRPAAGLQVGTFDPTARPRVAFLFTGQGSQYPGMGHGLYRTQPVFRDALDRCDAILRPLLDRSLIELLYGPDGTGSAGDPELDRTACTQPALFALEYALAELWRSWGVEPFLVMGHSVGEYAAACVAGIFPLEDGLRLIAERGRLMQSLPSGGRMAAVFDDERSVSAAVAPHADRVSVAAINGPANTVISGDGEAVEAITRAFKEKGIESRSLRVSHAFHSPRMDPVLDEFERTARTLSYSRPRVGLVSNVTGKPAERDEVSRAEYWRRHVRQPVRFADSVRAVHAAGCRFFVEIGPHPVLLGMGVKCLPEGDGHWLPSLRRNQDDWSRMLASLGALYVGGVGIDWAGFDSGYRRRKLFLPTYPFQRERFPVPEASSAGVRHRAGLRAPSTADHPLLGPPLPTPLEERVWESRLDHPGCAFLDHHCVFSRVVVPAAAFLEMGLAAARRLGTGAPIELHDIVIQQALVLNRDAGRLVQTVVSPDRGAGAVFRIFSASGSDDEPRWTLHASGTIRGAEATRFPEDAEAVPFEEVRARCADRIDADAFYESMAGCGLDFGDSFRGVERLWRRDGESLGAIRPPASLGEPSDSFAMHPALLDAGIQVLAASLPSDRRDGAEPYLPLGVDSFVLHGRPSGRLWSHATLDAGSAGEPLIRGEVRICAEDGRVVATLRGLALKRADREAVELAVGGGRDELLHRISWIPRPREPRAGVGAPPTFLPSPDEVIRNLGERARRLGEEADLTSYRRLLPALERISTEYVRSALHRLGWAFRSGDRVSREDLGARFGVAAEHRRLLERMLEICEEDGLLRRAGDRWETLDRPPGESESGTGPEVAPEDAPAIDAEATFVSRCGGRLAEALRGEVDPLELLFPGGTFDTAERLYRDSPAARVYNGLVAETVAEAVKTVPEGRKLRILEIGAGTGGTTAAVLDRLDGGRAGYTFTDISAAFTARAESSFASYPFVEFRTLDIEEAPETQGFDAGSYDVVIAANVLHATADLRRTLEHVRCLMAPGGLLVLSEVTRPQRWVDITFGLTAGWWRFRDSELRPSYPLLGVDRWLSLLAECGFEAAAPMQVATAAESDGGGEVVLLARAAARTVPEGQGTWMILCDRGGVGRALARRLEDLGEPSVLVFAGETGRAENPGEFRADPERSGELRDLVRRLLGSEESRCRGVVHLWSLDEPFAAGPSPERLDAAQALICGSALELVQALAGIDSSPPPGLWLVTRGAVPSGPEGDAPAVASSTLWGLGRVVALEHPELRCVRLDLDPVAGRDSTAELVEELLHADGEDQIAFRHPVRYAARLEAGRGDAASPGGAVRPYELTVGSRGTLENLELRAAARRPPGPGEVEVGVRATGLNFRDVLNAMGLYPGDPPPFGSECAGRITAIGKGVRHLRVGDDVIVLAPGSFASHVTADEGFVLRKPPGLGFAAAATVPVAYVTAWFTLHHLARVTRGDRVLIHAAAGGVGLAAVHLALRAGAEVFATAGAHEKREYLRGLGVEHVMDSRSTAFAAQVMEATGGRGVDVVLNSLSDELIAASFSALARSGRFLELGKRGIWSADRVEALGRGIRYFVVDWGETAREDPVLIQTILRTVVDEIGSGTLPPPARQVFALARHVEAFRTMAQARHIGKIVLIHEEPARTREEREGRAIRPDATYLVTGGTRGLGLLVAGRLARLGARNLILIGRRPPDDEARESIRELEAEGVRVRVARADVSRRAEVEAALSEASNGWPPLRGVIHSAGVLDDGVLVQQSWDRFEAVMAPKVRGGWLLHELTADLPVEFFVLFSSVASVFGSPGQGNHAAANAFLDALAHYRRARGLPATSINWGAWSEVGIAARQKVDQRVNVRGIRAIPPGLGLGILEDLLLGGPAQAAVVSVDWSQFLGTSGGAAAPPFFRLLAMPPRPEPVAGEAKVSRRPLLERLNSAPAAKQRKLLTDCVREHAARVLGFGPARPVDAQLPLSELGLDSLMAVELRNALGAELERTLPATLLFDYPTIASLVEYLLDEIVGRGAEGPTEPRDEAASGESGDPLRRIEDLSDEEVERILAEKSGGQEDDG